MNADGTMARRPDLVRFARRHKLALLSVADLIRYRLERERLVRARRASGRSRVDGLGEFTAVAYAATVDAAVHVALVQGRRGRRRAGARPRDAPRLPRSATLLGSAGCDCGCQLRAGLPAHRARRGAGVLVYLQKDAAGDGQAAVHPRLRRGGGARAAGPDAAARVRRGRADPARTWALARLRLLTNNPKKIVGLRELRARGGGAGAHHSSRRPRTGPTWRRKRALGAPAAARPAGLRPETKRPGERRRGHMPRIIEGTPGRRRGRVRPLRVALQQLHHRGAAQGRRRHAGAPRRGATTTSTSYRVPGTFELPQAGPPGRRLGGATRAWSRWARSSAAAPRTSTTSPPRCSKGIGAGGARGALRGHLRRAHLRHRRAGHRPRRASRPATRARTRRWPAIEMANLLRELAAARSAGAAEEGPMKKGRWAHGRSRHVSGRCRRSTSSR